MINRRQILILIILIAACVCVPLVLDAENNYFVAYLFMAFT